METTKTLQEVSKAQIDAWKKQYGMVFKYVSSDKKEGYFRTATLNIIDACRATSNGSATEFNRMLAKNCWLGGDAEIVENDDYLMGLFDWLPALINKIHGELEQL